MQFILILLISYQKKKGNVDMSYIAPDHFSYKFELKLNKIPTKQADRISLNLLFPGLIAAVCLIVIGLFELTKGSRPQDNSMLNDVIPAWFNITFFDCVMILLGIWIIITLLMNYFNYKKVFFDGKKITMVYRSPFGAKTTVKENIKKYKGVRFRIEFFQFGFINKNKYIIELFHDDSEKIAPLYISTKEKNIRNIWEYYARQLNLPTIIDTDEGAIIREIKDIGKSLHELHEDGLLKNEFNFKEPLPATIAWVRKKDKSVIKNRKIRVDGYNVLVWFFVAIGALFLLTCYETILQKPAMIVFSLALLVIMIFATLKSLTKDKLVIKPKKIVIVHKTFFLSRKKYEIMKDEIETIDVAFNPASERYFIAIIGCGKTVVFGKKLPIEDLRWIKKFLINDIVKK